MSSLGSIHRQASGTRLRSPSTESRAAFVIVMTYPEVGLSSTVCAHSPLGCVGRLARHTLDLGSIQRQQTRGTGRICGLNGKAGFERSFCFELGTFVTVKQRFLQTFNWL